MRIHGLFKILALALFTLLTAQAAASAQAGIQSGSILHDGTARTYLYYLPTSYNAGQLVPLVIALHGGGGTGRTAMRGTNFNTLAEAQGFIVVYPDGIDGWNDGRTFAANRVQDADDVGFINALLDEFVGRYAVDETRIFATGGSNGGMMSFRLACELTDRLAAVATAVANMPVELAEACAPSRPIPILMMMGTADPLMPFDGGFVGLGRRGAVISARDTVQFWLDHNMCTSEAQSVQLPDHDPTDNTLVTLHAYTNCERGSTVQWYLMEGGGHGWPGRPQQSSVSRSGHTVQDVNATQVVWDFFALVHREP